MSMWEFIDNLSDEKIEKFIDQLDNYKEGLKDNYKLVKKQLGYIEVFDKNCLHDMNHIDNGSINDGYQGFIYKEDIEKFYNDNEENFVNYLKDYLDSNGLNTFDSLLSIIANDMNMSSFLEDIALYKSVDVKRNIAKFVASEIIYDVMNSFREYFKEDIKNSEE